jgi:hypothetical protein
MLSSFNLSDSDMIATLKSPSQVTSTLESAMNKKTIESEIWDVNKSQKLDLAYSRLRVS